MRAAWVVALLLVAAGAARADVVLLGEVHDNARQHVLRLERFDALLATGKRPALLLEQFDRERQADIDRSRTSADALIAAGSDAKSGWTWSHYKPFIERALAHGLPIVAVNVSRDDARRVIAQGLAATGFQASVPADLEAAHAALIEASHCGMVDATQARRMAAAQIARDQFMARSVEAYAARGVLLLAGNGHVGRDIGVPRWLPQPLRGQAVAIGMLEEGDPGAAAYDRAIFTPAQPRADPCLALRKKASAP